MKLLVLGLTAGTLLAGCGTMPAGAPTTAPMAKLQTQTPMAMGADMGTMAAACAASMSMTPEAMNAMMRDGMMASGSMMMGGAMMGSGGMMGTTATPTAPAQSDEHAGHH